ncbi:MAG: glycosyltransferase family 2 protein [Bacteroidota bacterium]
MELKNLGLVILNYNSHKMVLECIRSINRYYEGEFQIVIVDNKSSDNSFNILHEAFSGFRNIRVIMSDHNGGYSYGNNYGLKYLINNYPEIKYLGIINPDVMVLDNLIFKNLIQKLDEDADLAGIAPLMIINDAIKPERWAFKLPSYIDNFISSLICLKWINPSVYRSFKINEVNLVSYVDTLPGSFIIIKKDIFERLNLFDERTFLYGEEIILGIKIKKEKLRLGLSFRDYYLHAHSNSKGNLRNDLLHLKYSLQSHIYINSNYCSKFWGTLNIALLILFLPYKMLELLIVYFNNKFRS